MKVGVIFGGTEPVSGGGFTFEDDLLRGLLEVAPTSAHEFVLIGSFSESIRKSTERFPSLAVRDLHLGWAGRVGRVGSTLLGTFSQFPRAAGWRSRVDRALSRMGVDLVWFVTPYYFEVDCPYIYTIWDLQHRMQPYFPEVGSQGRWEHRERFYSSAVGRAALVIVPNSAGQAELERFYGVPPHRIRALAHPTPGFAITAANDPLPIRPDPVQQLPNYFLYPAQFFPHKNHVGLVHALRKASDKEGHTLYLVLVGSDKGNFSHVARTIAALGLRSQVLNLGFVSRSVLTSLYRHATGLVYPSYFGPENLPPLEAFALACPVIAARVSGSEEQLGDAALLVDPTDFEGFADAMVALCRDPDMRSRLVAAGKTRALSWTAREYVLAVCSFFDRFARTRSCW